jgi:hypothetical protein
MGAQLCPVIDTLRYHQKAMARRPFKLVRALVYYSIVFWLRAKYIGNKTREKALVQ